MSKELQKAVDIICDELRKDKSPGSYYWSWKANIAMAFQDCYDKYDGSETIRTISNEAADDFLTILLGTNKDKP